MAPIDNDESCEFMKASIVFKEMQEIKDEIKKELSYINSVMGKLMQKIDSHIENLNIHVCPPCHQLEKHVDNEFKSLMLIIAFVGSGAAIISAVVAIVMSKF